MENYNLFINGDDFLHEILVVFKNICTRGKKSLVWEIPTTRYDWQIDLFLSCFLLKFWAFWDQLLRSIMLLII